MHAKNSGHGVVTNELLNKVSEVSLSSVQTTLLTACTLYRDGCDTNHMAMQVTDPSKL